jgi:hypothetical protein
MYREALVFPAVFSGMVFGLFSNEYLRCRETSGFGAAIDYIKLASIVPGIYGGLMAVFRA